MQVHNRAKLSGALSTNESNEFEGWHRQQGSTRIVWLPPDGQVVYKIAIAYEDSNELEHENMCRWRRHGKAWAPETELFPVDGGAPILAMAYYSERITSADEIPDDLRNDRAAEFSTDHLIENFRRRQDGQVMLIDAGEIIVPLGGATSA